MILDIAREQVLEQGIGLDEAQILQVLKLPDGFVDDALELAHEVRMRWCGPEVEVEGIVSIKTGGCPRARQTSNWRSPHDPRHRP